MKKYFFFLLLLFFIISCTENPNNCDTCQTDNINEVYICGVFSLSEKLTDLGQDSKVAMELAIDDFSAMLQKNGINFEIKYVVEDSKLDPEITKEIIETRYKEGYRIFIGPTSSAEIANIKNYVNSNNMLVISHFSTSSALSIQDNIFRFCPPDKLESYSMSKYLITQNKNAIVPIYLNDSGNEGLYLSLKSAYTQDGGKIYPPVLIETSTTNYQQVINNLRNVLIQALDENPTEEVAIYYAGFNECINIFELASQDEVFSTVKWYCGDGIALNESIFQGTNSLSFAKKVGLQSPTIGLDVTASSIYEPLIARIKATTGKNNVNNYALGVYDATWLALISKLNVRSNKFSELKAQFLKNTNEYFGATGFTKLDANGDRQYSTFDFWMIDPVNSIWKQTARYNILKNSWDYIN